MQACAFQEGNNYTVKKRAEGEANNISAARDCPVNPLGLGEKLRGSLKGRLVACNNSNLAA